MCSRFCLSLAGRDLTAAGLITLFPPTSGNGMNPYFAYGDTNPVGKPL
jgi:hypothetical protein